MVILLKTCTGNHADELLLALPFLLEMKQSILKRAIYTVPPLISAFIRNRIKSRKFDVPVLYQVALCLPASGEGRAGEAGGGGKGRRDTQRSNEQEKDVSCRR